MERAVGGAKRELSGPPSQRTLRGEGEEWAGAEALGRENREVRRDMERLLCWAIMFTH